MMTLRNFGLGKDSMEERIHGELQHVIKTLEKSIGASSVGLHSPNKDGRVNCSVTMTSEHHKYSVNIN